MPKTLYMVVEHFKNKDAVPVYRRFRDRGRMAPEGLVYVSSWVDDKRERCYQVMETHDPALLDEQARRASWLPAGHAEGFAETFKALYVAVYAAVAAGKPGAGYPTFADGHESMLVCETVARSSRERRWIEVRR